MMSLNPIPSKINYYELVQKLIWFNLGRKNKLSLDQYIYFKEIDLDKVVNKPFNRLEYYKSKSKGCRVRATVND